MKIHEYQAKELLRAAGVAVPQGIVATTPDEATSAFKTLNGPLAVVKAQIHAAAAAREPSRANRSSTGSNSCEAARTRPEWLLSCSACRW